MLVDSKDNLWVLTNKNLIKISDENWTHYTLTALGLVNCMAIDSKDNIWFGTKEGLAKFDGENLTKDTRFDKEILQIAIDSKDNIWVITSPQGMNHKLIQINQTGLTEHIIDTPIYMFNCLAIDQNDNKWIGTHKKALIKFDGINWTKYNSGNSGISDNFVNCIAIDKQGNKWVGTEFGGLCVYKGN